MLCASAIVQECAIQQQAAAGIEVAMPFVMRKVEPRHLCRGHVPADSQPDWPVGAELEAVANGALTSSLRQLASLLTTAEDIFASLTGELARVAERSGHLRRKIDQVEKRLGTVDPKKIPVREYTFLPARCSSCLLAIEDFRPMTMGDLIGAVGPARPCNYHGTSVASLSAPSDRRDRQGLPGYQFPETGYIRVASVSRVLFIALQGICDLPWNSQMPEGSKFASSKISAGKYRLDCQRSSMLGRSMFFFFN